MSVKVAELSALFNQDDEAAWVANLWDKFNQQRAGKIEEWKELRNYIFATDTSTTTNQSLPWKNSTTIPKLCQIRDNLHSNYVSALFPNDNFVKWEAHSQDAATKKKAQAIEQYIANKARLSNLKTTYSKLLYDYIDYGNAFVTTAYVNEYKELANGERVTSFMGPKSYRISPLDIVFNPLADSFEETFKIVRSVKTLGELKKLSQDEPENAFWADVLERRQGLRTRLGGYSKEDFDKAVGYTADGFGNMYEYYMGDYVEILEFFGDYHTKDGVLATNQVLTVVDRSYTARSEDIPSWQGSSPIRHVGWRMRQDNLWAMGPLDNLVGMQYRLDHLENLKADAMDLLVHPPLKIIGEVEEFVYGPSAEIHIDENGDVQELGKNLSGVIAANNDIEATEMRMEMYAGAPREAMGIRTAGEKTAFEVGQLATAGGRIFQEKITNLEVNLLEPNLNDHLEIAVRNLDQTDVIRVIDDDFGVEEFLSITKEDITANGKIRPIGARHFAKQAQDLQNLMGVFNSPIGQMVMPHTSAKVMTQVISDIIGLDGYKLFEPNISIVEQQELQSAAQQAQSSLQGEQEATNIMAEEGL
tara:strand:- start:5152 stop:6912 length:1761 start_codon:yes stop_codon:yes gene_type:complete